MVEIADQPARRGERGAAELAESVERRHAEQSLQPRLARAAVELAARTSHRGGGIALFRGDHLGGAEPRQLGGETGAVAGDHLEAAGGHVRRGERHLARGLTDRDAPVGGA